MLTSTVVITTYNRPEYLAEAVESVRCQSRLPDEVVVIDDGSTPPAVVTNTGSLTIRVVRQANSGLAAARNRGVAESRSDVVFFLDDDDVFAAARIDSALMHHERHDIVTCAQTTLDRRRASPPARTHQEIELTHASDLLSLTTPSFGATSVTRKEWVPLDESYLASQDVEWWVRMAEVHRSVLRIPEYGLLVRRHSGIRHGNGATARLHASMRILSEHAPFFSAHPRARSFRLARISIVSSATDRRRDAFRIAVLAILLRPSRPAVFALLLSVCPRTTKWLRRRSGDVDT